MANPITDFLTWKNQSSIGKSKPTKSINLLSAHQSLSKLMTKTHLTSISSILAKKGSKNNQIIKKTNDPFIINTHIPINNIKSLSTKFTHSLLNSLAIRFADIEFIRFIDTVMSG